MKHEIEGSDLRACIDKAYDAGYNEAVRKACEWLENNIWRYTGIDYTTLNESFKIAMKNED